MKRILFDPLNYPGHLSLYEIESRAAEAVLAEAKKLKKTKLKKTSPEGYPRADRTSGGTGTTVTCPTPDEVGRGVRCRRGRFSKT
jgi:hypothetical protein